MSKTDALRAIKQARAAAAASAAPARPAAPRPATPARAATVPAAAVPAATPLPDLAPEALCGHANMGGKRCTRPQGHAEKNHRYAA